MSSKKIPVILITGYLGAGKTSIKHSEKVQKSVIASPALFGIWGRFGDVVRIPAYPRNAKKQTPAVIIGQDVFRYFSYLCNLSPDITIIYTETL